MGEWAYNPETQRVEWRENGRWQPQRPMIEPPPRVGNTQFEQDVGVPLTGFLEEVGAAPFNLGRSVENAAAGAVNYFSAPVNNRAQPDTPTLAPQRELPGAVEYDPSMFGVQSGGPSFESFTPEEMPYAPERQVDPSLQGREDYLRGRNDRVGTIFDQYLNELRRTDPSDDPWWQRLGGALGAIAARPTLAEAGVATSEYFASEAERRMAIQEAMMQLGLREEDLAGELSEADLAQLSGTFQAEQGTAQDRYTVDTANVDSRNRASIANTENRNRSAAAGWEANQQLAISRYEQAQAELRQQLAAAAGLGDVGAAESMFGRLPTEMQQGASQQLALRSLATILEESGGRAHRRMEALAGRSLPRPPREARGSSMAMARWYSRNGVDLNNPEIRDAFPGFGGEE